MCFRHIAVVLALLAATSRPAAAQGPTTVERAANERAAEDSEWEAGLSGGLMGGGLTLAALLVPREGETPRNVGIGVAAFALYLAPSTGRLAGGDWLGTAKHLGLRTALPGAAFAAAYFLRRSAEGATPERDERALVYGATAGAVTMLALAIWDVSTIADDLRAHRRKRSFDLRAVPLGPDGTPGVGVVGSF